MGYVVDNSYVYHYKIETWHDGRKLARIWLDGSLINPPKADGTFSLTPFESLYAAARDATGCKAVSKISDMP